MLAALHARITDMRRRESQGEVTQPDQPTPEGWDPQTIDHDDSLIQWMLELSPTQRLAVAQGFVDSVRILRSARRTPVSRHS